MIKGTIPYVLSADTSSHVKRAFWLTTKVETGAKYGAIMMADGTAMTAGLDQHIAVYPKELAKEDYNAKNDQGSLWQLLRRLGTVDDSADVTAVGGRRYGDCLQVIWDALKRNGYYLAQDGTLRYLGLGQSLIDRRWVDRKPGDLVFGSDIREMFTPGGGQVPKKDSAWAKAAWWASAFHELFAHPLAHRAQVDFGIEHLVHRTRQRRSWKYGTSRLASVQDIAYRVDITATRTGPDMAGPEYMGPEYDLAMCMYHSHSVNAPAIANRCLDRALKTCGIVSPPVRPIFAKQLIKLLGTSSYGRWDDDIKFGRYQRTRSAARMSGLWPRSLFDGPDAIMPKDLPG